jgi:hypothetical protein
MKKSLSILLSALILITATFGLYTTAQANNVYKFSLGRNGVKGDVYYASDGSKIVVDQYDFKVPANGTVTLSFFGINDAEPSSDKQILKCSFYNRTTGDLSEFKTKLDYGQYGNSSSLKKTFTVKRGNTYGFGIGAGHYDTEIGYWVGFNYKPNAPQIKKLTPQSKKIKATWNKVTAVSGYQLQYSTSKNFKNKKTITTHSYKDVTKYATKLKKGKRYYFRVRAFYKKDGRTWNSKWSKTKSVVCK